MSDPTQTDNRELHRRIGLAALQRNYVTVDVLADAMLRAGESPSATPADIWITSNALDRTELAEIIQVVAPENDAARRRSRRPTPSGVSPPAAEVQDFVEDPGRSYTLADVVKTHGGRGAIRLQRAYPDDRKTTGTQESAAHAVVSDWQTGPALATGIHPVVADSQASGVFSEQARYLIGGELGRGGVGRVMKAFDRYLGRTVAMKLPLMNDATSAEIDKFIEEAQATGQLEHPNIVPIYDMGVMPNGEIYYTMKRVRNQSLRDVIDGLKAENPRFQEEYGPTRLLTIFLQVCQAIHYAHVRGVIHRDLKPDNVMLGDYGEIHVMDWGLARVMDRDVVTDRSLAGAEKLQEGQTVGTPAYMPPEQARGLLSLVDERSDIYSLGVTLYEMMTLRQPSTRSTVWETLFAVISEPITPPSQRAPSRNINPEMDRIIMRALEKDPSKRWSTAKEFHDAVEKFLDGRNEREAERNLLNGEGAMRMYEQAKLDLLRLDKLVEEALSRIQAWDDSDIKRMVWDLQDRRRESDARMVRHFGDAVRDLARALVYLPGLSSAREALARLYWSRYELAEREDDKRDQIYYLSLLRQYDDGTYLNRINDNAPVSVYTTPRAAAVFFTAYEEQDRTFQAVDTQFLGYTPLAEFFMRRGSYLLHIKHPSFPLVRFPLYIHRADPVGVHFDMPPVELFRPGFEFIPPGISIIGGDHEAVDPYPMTRVQVDGYFIQKFPVTFREYLAFLNDLACSSEAEALARAPRTRDADGTLVIRDENGRFIPSPILIEGAMRQLYPEGQDHEYELPILAIRRQDALAYAAWRSAREGILFRLPTEMEWERAARGADGRFYPWGNEFDATFCKMAQSRPMASQPEPVGMFPIDRSPFEVFDMAGGVREFVDSDVNDLDQCIVRGGYWMGDARSCRVASRRRVFTDGRLANVGFRLAYSVP